MAELKTKATSADVDTFIEAVPDTALRENLRWLTALMTRVTKAPPRMWGASMVGFGQYHYTYATGREGDWFIVGFSPRKQNLTLYFMCGFEPLAVHLEKLGKHKLGKSCLYVKSLSDIDRKVLEQMVRTCVRHVERHQGCGTKDKTKTDL